MRVDRGLTHGRRCPKGLSCNVSPRVGDQSVHKAASIPFVVHDAMDGSM